MKCECGNEFEGNFCPNCGSANILKKPQQSVNRDNNAAYIPSAPPTGYTGYTGYPVYAASADSIKEKSVLILKKIGIGAMIIWGFAFLLLMAGYFFPAVLWAAGGACICPPQKEKLSAMFNVKPNWLYVAAAILLFFGFFSWPL